jgi:hypothetical protein
MKTRLGVVLPKCSLPGLVNHRDNSHTLCLSDLLEQQNHIGSRGRIQSLITRTIE